MADMHPLFERTSINKLISYWASRACAVIAVKRHLLCFGHETLYQDPREAFRLGIFKNRVVRISGHTRVEVTERSHNCIMEKFIKRALHQIPYY
jgi:hypothetical protein